MPGGKSELKWEESEASVKTDSRRPGRRPVRSRSRVLENISCLPPLPQLQPDQLGPWRREGKTEALPMTVTGRH